MKCRFCQNYLNHIFIDLLNAPPSNSYLSIDQLNEPEIYFPLKIYICDKCWLAQIDEYKKSSEIFNNDYAYFSSYSSTWLKHSSDYVDMIVEKLNLNNSSQVIEIASNDGYLLQYFKQKSIPCLGIEPTSCTAEAAIKKGINTIVDFFTEEFAKRYIRHAEKADLVIGNNVLAHVPDIFDFVKGVQVILKETGTITMEFPHLLNLIKFNQFDTIYHEHFSYLSLLSVTTIFNSIGLTIYDVEEIPTHGGSLRIYATHTSNNISTSANLNRILCQEKEFGLSRIETYGAFKSNVIKIKYDLLDFLISQKKNGKIVSAYGAAAKGNTLLNYCGIKNDMIDFVVDASPFKQGKYLPGSHIPVVSEAYIKANKPDYIIIFPWNIKDEIIQQLEYVRLWDCKFVIAVPHLDIF